MNVNWKVQIIIWGFCLYVYEEVSPCFGNAHTQHILLKQKPHLGIAKVIAKVKLKKVGYLLVFAQCPSNALQCPFKWTFCMI